MRTSRLQQALQHLGSSDCTSPADSGTVPGSMGSSRPRHGHWGQTGVSLPQLLSMLRRSTPAKLQLSLWSPPCIGATAQNLPAIETKSRTLQAAGSLGRSSAEPTAGRSGRSFQRNSGSQDLRPSRRTEKAAPFTAKGWLSFLGAAGFLDAAPLGGRCACLSPTAR